MTVKRTFLETRPIEILTGNDHQGRQIVVATQELASSQGHYGKIYHYNKLGKPIVTEVIDQAPCSSGHKLTSPDGKLRVIANARLGIPIETHLTYVSGKTEKNRFPLKRVDCSYLDAFGEKVKGMMPKHGDFLTKDVLIPFHNARRG